MLSAAGTRIVSDRLEELFHAHYGAAAEYESVHAPGRVNLIGEHLDYNGLPVLPMALRRGITIVFRPREDHRLRLFHADPSYTPIDEPIATLDHRFSRGGWSDYVSASSSSLSRHFPDLRGFDGVLDGDLPIAAGLSSSTALVVAIARALIAVNHLSVEPLDLIECLCEGERKIGAPGGAMDQAVCVSGAPNVALKVEFEPLALHPIPIPENWQFIVAYSLVEAEKAGAVERVCRTRISECSQALAALAAAGVAGAQSYGTVLTAHDDPDLLRVAERVLRGTLQQRFRHVITEARRVEQAEEALRTQDSATFGHLMFDSHSSLTHDFEVSHPALNRLVEICARNGAHGARLTGAGFGGSIVALCSAATTDSLIEALKHEYYASLRCDIERVLFHV